MNLYIYIHNRMVPVHKKFTDDIFARFLVIKKNSAISFIKEYKGPILRPPCDVIDNVIIRKKLFCTSFGTILSEVKLKLCLISKNFLNGRHF